MNVIAIFSPQKDAPETYCENCDRNFASKINYRRHLVSIQHNKQLLSPTKKKATPDENDPNY